MVSGGTATEYHTVTKTVTSIMTSSTVSFEKDSATMSVDLSGQLSGYINATINETVNSLNNDIVRHIQPSIESSIENWNSSWYNMWLYQTHIYSTLYTLNESISTNLVTQSKTINETIDTLDQQGFLLSIGSESIDISGLYLNYSYIIALINDTISEYSNSTSLSALSLPTISLNNVTFDGFYNSSLVTSFLEDFKSNIGNNNTTMRHANIFKREQNTGQTNKKPIKLSIILLSTYPALMLAMCIVEWLCYRLEMESIAEYLTILLDTSIDKHTTPTVQRKRRLQLLILCDSLKYPFSKKLSYWICYLKGLFRRTTFRAGDPVVHSNPYERPSQRVSWWIWSRCVPLWLFLCFILLAWVVLTSILPQAYDQSLSKRDYPYAKRQDMNSVMFSLADQFQTEITGSLSTNIDDFYTTTLALSLSSINNHMVELTSKLPTSLTSFLPWENITEFQEISLPNFNISSFLENYLLSFSESSSIELVLHKRSTIETPDTQKQINALFQKSIMAWALLFVFQVVISFVF